MHIISIYTDKGNYQKWWRNFDDYYTPLWKKTGPNPNPNALSDWNKFVNKLGFFKVSNKDSSKIEFETEEDMIKFLLRWS